MPDDAARYAEIDRILDGIMLKHFEMAELVGGYRDMLADLEEQRVPDPTNVQLARSLPGARYHVATTYVREQWLKFVAEVGLLFPPDEER